MLAHRPVATQHVARPRQQVDEVERALAILEHLVAVDCRRQLLLQHRRQVGVRISPELQQSHVERVACGNDLRARRGAVACAVSLARLGQAAVVAEIDQPRFPAIKVPLMERSNLPRRRSFRQHWPTRGGASGCLAPTRSSPGARGQAPLPEAIRRRRGPLAFHRPGVFSPEITARTLLR